MGLRTTIIAFACTASVAAYAIADTPKVVSVQAGDLIDALDSLARQCGVDVIYPSSQLKGLKTNGVSGTLDTREAFAKLIEGTSLVLKEEGTSVLIALPRNPGKTTENSPRQDTQPTDAKEAQKKSFWDRFRMAQVAEGPAASAGSVAESTAASAEKSVSIVEEVVVTAQKRIERLLEVPVPVSAIGADDLLEGNQLGLQDYFTRVPGLTFTTGNRSEPFVAIRGITTTPFANPTVGVTVDDVPYGPTSLRGGGLIAPDIDPSDLERVEVLRGPQGTLYGVSSLGGLIKYVTVDPSTSGFSARLQGGIASVHNGDEMGYSARGSINVPISDSLAVRASGFARQESGYVDNPALGLDGVNEGDASGGRLSGLWKPSEAFSLKLAALYQERNTDGSGLVFRLPGLGDLQQSYVRDAGWLRTKVEAYSATLWGKLGDVELTSLTGYNVNRIANSVDTSPFFSGAANLNFGVTGAPFLDDYKTNKLTQELRMVTFTGERLEWLLGGFYTKEEARNSATILAVDAATGRVAGVLGRDYYPTTYEEYAGFADVTVHFTDRFDVQIGARQSHNRQTLSEVTSGPVFGAGAVTPRISLTDDPFTYLVTPRFKVSPDLMVYARFASGYRAGVINPNSFNFPNLPTGADHDTTQNYELGVKGSVMDRLLSFDASLYYIEWKDIQLAFIASGGAGSYQTNGGRAKSQGLELSVEAHPWTGFSVLASAAWSDAQLSESFTPPNPLRGASGDRLPFSSRFSGNLSVDQEFPLSGSMTGFVGSSVSYVGDRIGLFQAGPVRQDYPAYTQVDLRAGLEFASWTASFFVNNVDDERGVLGGGLGGINPAAFIYIQPRTAGLSISKVF
jgi:iron complex outermembrane recepter protein